MEQPSPSGTTQSDRQILEVLVGKTAAARLLENAGGSLGQVLRERAPAVYCKQDVRHVLGAAFELVNRALHEEMRQTDLLASPQAVKDFLRLRLRELEHEVFVVLYLDAQNRLLRAEELFRGTLTQTSVYPREVVKQALRFNAAAVILAHNHPSRVAEPSRADELLTRALRDALAMVDVRVHDHLIVAGATAVSLAERGLL